MAKGAKVPEDEWGACLLGTARHMVLGRRTFGILPSDPRCKFCSIPFRGPGGFVFRHLSEKYGPWDKNPNLCRRCVIGLGSAEVMGAEVDVSCFICGGTGEGCRTCRGEGWIELLGAGMVHPNVLRAGGYDPDEVSGFAAGSGIERPFMLRSGLADLRTLVVEEPEWRRLDPDGRSFVDLDDPADLAARDPGPR